MPDERFRELLGRVDTGPGEPRREFAAELWTRLERELQMSEEEIEGGAVSGGTGEGPLAVPALTERLPRRWPRVAIAAGLVVLIGVGVALVRAGDGGEAETGPITAPDQTTVPDASTTLVEPGAEQVPVPTAPVGWSDAPVPECDAPADHALGPDGVLWVGSLGLYRWDGEWTHFTHDDGLPAGPDFDPDPEFPSGGPCGPDSAAPAVTDVEVAPDGTLWMANGAGISTYDGDQFTVVAQYPGGVPPETFGGLLRVDGNGDVWFPTFERVENPTGEDDPETGEPGVFLTEPLSGVARLDDGIWSEFPLGATTGPAGAPLVSDDGSAFWVGSDEAYELVDGAWVEIDVRELLTLGSLFAANATVGPDGGLWVSVTAGEGVAAVARWAGGGWTIHSDGMPSIFGQLIVAPDGTLWAPLWSPDTPGGDGLAAFDGTTWSIHELEGVEPTCPPFSMMADGATIWVRGPWCNSLRYTPGA